MVVAGGWQGAEGVVMGSYYLMGIQFQFYKMTTVIDTDGCDECTLRTYLIPMNCIL